MTYTNRNGYQLPNLTLPPQKKHPLGEAKLSEHLWEIEQTAKEQVRQTVEQMAEEQGMNEQMKRQNPMLWVQTMNNLKALAEEIVLNQLIFV